MALQTENLLGSIDKIGKAIERIKTMEDMALQMDAEGYYVAISGGKDSSVIQQLCIEAGVKCAFYHNHTGLDHPETVYFVRREKTRIESLGYNFTIQANRLPNGQQATLLSKTKLSPSIGLPTQTRRWCCAVLKEWGGASRYVVTGVRWAESTKRKSREVHEVIGKTKADGLYLHNDNDMRRKIMDTCLSKHKVVLNPIIDWTDKDVWEYIKLRNLPMNPLYKKGFHRIGCIGCPMSSKRKKELDDMPGYKKYWLKAATNCIEGRRAKGLDIPNSIGGKNATGQTYFDWWISIGSAKNGFDLWVVDE